MKKLFAFTLSGLLILSSLLIAQPVRAAENDYYVSTIGNDSNSGTLEQPFRSIQKAADIVVAGDTVYVRNGLYAEKVVVQNSGAADNYITFSSYPDETAILDLSGITMSTKFEGGFTINEKKYIQILGFQIQNSANGLGIICHRADHCILKNNKTYLAGIASVESTNVTIDGNEVQLTSGDSNQEMISVVNSSLVNITRDRPAFKLRISQNNADKADYAYIDSVEISGVMQQSSTSKIIVYSLISLFILLGVIYLLKVEN